MRRSRILRELPKRLRDQLDEKLRANFFSEYVSLSQWLANEGYQISRAALQRYGSRFQQQVESIRLASEQAREIALAAPDRENAMTDALTRLVQERMFALLVETENVSERDLPRISRAIADLAHASISQKRWAEEISERLSHQKRAADQRLAAIENRRGLSPEAVQEIRTILLGIDPFESGKQPKVQLTGAENA